MTREEAIKRIDEQYKICKEFYYLSANPEKDYPGVMSYMKALGMAISALRPVSREQMEKVWRGEWEHTHSIDNLWTEVWVCSHCGFEDDNGDCFDFCPACGKAMTDEAVEMVIERLEALQNEAEAD